MKRRGRRVVLIAVIILLSLGLIAAGVAVWLHQSGRLAAVATDLIQRFGKQDVTIGTVKVTSWDTLVLTDVHLSQHLSGWRLTLACPRLEIHYGLSGLLNKQIDSVAIAQPQIDLFHQPDMVLPTSSQPPGAFPFNRLMVQQGVLHIRWRNHTYTIQQLAARIQPQADQHVQAEANGILDGDTARLQLTANVDLQHPQAAGHAHLQTKSASLVRLTEMLGQVTPLPFDVSQGSLDLEIDLRLQAPTLQGVINATALQADMHLQDVALQQATLSSRISLTADNNEQTFRLHGQVELQAAQLVKTPDLTLQQVSGSTDFDLDATSAWQRLKASGQIRLAAKTLQAADLHLADVSLITPWHVTHPAAGWQITTTPELQSRSARLGALLNASHVALSNSVPVQIQIQPEAAGLQVQATPELQVRSLQVNQTQPPLRIMELHGKFPLRGRAMRLSVADAHLQTRAWQQAGAATPLLTTLRLQGSATIDLQHHRLVWQEMVASVPQLGKTSSSGVWEWPSHTLRDLHLQLAPDTIAALRTALQPVLANGYQGWEMNGYGKLDLQAGSISLRPPWRLQNLAMDWQIRDGSFSSPDSTYAGEHVNGIIQVNANLDTATDQYKLRGTLTLAPFAVLLGTFFPAIEANQISTNATFSSVYAPDTKRLDLRLAGHFHNVVRITLQGVVQQPLTAPRYDLQLQLDELRSNRVWSTFVHDPLQFPTLAQATVEGELNAALQVTGQASDLHLKGQVNLTGGHLKTGDVSLTGVTLALPIEGHYPLPTIAPQAATLPAAAYGQLSIDALRLGAIKINHLSTRLALKSDNLVLQPTIDLPLWGGQIRLQQVTAQHLLQAQRRFSGQARLRHLDLQRLPRTAAKLPLAGVVDGDFPQLQIVDGRFETQGSLTISVANGTIHLFDLQGRDLFSSLPVVQCSLKTEKPLSLARLTDIYPIGGIGGSLHFTLTDLTLRAGEAEAFGLDFAVEEKSGEAHQITLRALNNLLFTAGSAKVASGFIGDTQRLPYKYFGVVATLHQDTLHLRGKYHDHQGNEYFMRAPLLGDGVSIINRVPDNGIPFRDFLRRLKATVLEKPDVQVK